MASEKCLIIRNVASMPSNITINKGGRYPIPKDSIEIIKERV